MGTDHGDPEGLTARCPVCGTEVRAEDIRALIAAVKKCCAATRVSETRVRPFPEVPQRRPDPLELPFVATFTKLVSSQNKTTYSHWSVHHADKKAWIAQVRLRLPRLFGLRAPWSRWKLERVYSGRNRELDFANLVGGAKPLIDVLTEFGIIVDDSPAHFLCEYDQRRDDSSRTILTLLEIRDARPTDEVR
jgi:hypothetical protein